MASESLMAAHHLFLGVQTASIFEYWTWMRSRLPPFPDRRLCTVHAGLRTGSILPLCQRTTRSLCFMILRPKNGRTGSQGSASSPLQRGRGMDGTYISIMLPENILAIVA